MLEHVSSGYESLHADLDTGRVSMWQQFVIGWPGDDDNGGAYIRILDGDDAAPRVISGVRTNLLSHYFWSARRGAVRIGAGSDNERVAPLAFVNVDSTAAVVVKADGATEITIRGLPAGTYSGGYTTDRQSSGPLGPFVTDGRAALTVAMPGAGVLSLRAAARGR
jgi:hypothetical protein